MKGSEVANLLTKVLAQAREDGVETVSIDTLDRIAADLQELVARTPDGVSAGEAAMEEYKVNLAASVSARDLAHQTTLELLRATIATGQSALKSALLVNGGAAVALLAFIGGVWAHIGSGPLPQLALVLAYFALGVLVAALGSGFTYLSQAGFGGEFGTHSNKVGRAARVATIVLVGAAYAFFGMCCWTAYCFFSAFGAAV